MFKIYNIEDFKSEKSIDNEFMFERFEDLNRPPDLQWPHKHSFYEILWLTSGSAVNRVDYHQTEIGPNTLFFISPGQLHQMSTTKNVKGYSITFTEEFLLLTSNNKDKLLSLSFLHNSSIQPFVKLTDDRVNEIKRLIEMLEYEIRLSEKSAMIISHLLFVLLNRIQRIIINTHDYIYDNVNSLRLRKFRELVDCHYLNEKKIEFYAQKLGLTPHRLNEVTKHITGKTAGDIIRERVLMETKRLLVHTDWNICKISEHLGFADLSYFSRQFRKKEKLTPLDYRNKMSEKFQNI
ncbi:helix-turn-helix domain-containing protein [Chryseobacterium lathyri]|uniref:AraC family transcriptional regulator n=1 Tax=Chryseobacterium lathyri TaxID=395933 RepID=A0A511Y7Z0_9FLAO|nr:AraC family transcriptional regulator [Chryseobacterium lathyri]GEN71312.1 AraC family transcriptional regulator [Chryseobacterium lathyri]